MRLVPDSRPGLPADGRTSHPHHFRNEQQQSVSTPLYRRSAPYLRGLPGCATRRLGLLRTANTQAVSRANRHHSLVNVYPVDPRDQSSEVDDPRYRVYFWHGSHSDEYEITGADVLEVLAWADHNAAGRTYSLWACFPAVDEVGVDLVRLAGWDPPAGDVGRPDHAVTVPASGRA